MGNLFGKSKPKQSTTSRVTEADKAVLQLKQQRDKLKQYQKKLTLSLERERLLAKSLLQDGELKVRSHLTRVHSNTNLFISYFFEEHFFFEIYGCFN